MSRLYRDIRVGESLTIGAAVVTLEKKSGRQARLRIEADDTVAVSSKGRENAKQPQAQECCSELENNTHGEHAI